MAKTLPFEVQGSRIVVDPDASPTEISGLALPESHMQKHRPSSGVVLQVGADLPTDMIGVRIVFGEHAGTHCRISDCDYLILSPDDILGFMPEGTPEPFPREAEHVAV